MVKGLLNNQEEYIPFEIVESTTKVSNKCYYCNVNVNAPCNKHFDSRCHYSCEYNTIPVSSMWPLLLFGLLYILAKKVDKWIKK